MCFRGDRCVTSRTLGPIVPLYRSLRACFHARRRRNVTMIHAFSCVQPEFIDLLDVHQIKPLPAHYRARVSSHNEKEIKYKINLDRSPPRWQSADWWTTHAFANIRDNSQAGGFLAMFSFTVKARNI
ncbi:jg20268 [Pararge aegeria aegeria]|uniref:Jg20268 protein n=1 Tax=Pararge aegeria aegeria TaxID=348720 RepID=A0A8S4R2A0_9NEOP|nr:jg20268 [Pararge aegeria aegeria]